MNDLTAKNKNIQEAGFGVSEERWEMNLKRESLTPATPLGNSDATLPSDILEIGTGK